MSVETARSEWPRSTLMTLAEAHGPSIAVEAAIDGCWTSNGWYLTRGGDSGSVAGANDMVTAFAALAKEMGLVACEAAAVSKAETTLPPRFAQLRRATHLHVEDAPASTTPIGTNVFEVELQGDLASVRSQCVKPGRAATLGTDAGNQTVTIVPSADANTFLSLVASRGVGAQRELSTERQRDRLSKGVTYRGVGLADVTLPGGEAIRLEHTWWEAGTATSWRANSAYLSEDPGLTPESPSASPSVDAAFQKMVASFKMKPCDP